MVCTTPIFPFSRPPSALPINAIQMFDAKPTMTSESKVPRHPRSRTGFLPTRSDSAPQCIPVSASASANEEMRRPE